MRAWSPRCRSTASGWPTTCSCWPTGASSCCAAGRARAGSSTTPTSPPRARRSCSSDWPARRCRRPSSWPPTPTRRPATSRRCSSRACREPRSPGRPPLGPLAAALAEIHAVDPAGIPPYRRYYEPERLAVPSWAADRGVWERAIALAHAAAAGAARALHPPRLPSRQHAVGGRGAHRHRRLDDRLARAGRGRPRPSALEPRGRPRPARRRRPPPPPRAPSLLRRRHRARRPARARPHRHPCRAPAPRGARRARACRRDRRRLGAARCCNSRRAAWWPPLACSTA